MTFSSDIIHPQDRGGPENGFVETWADRKARQPVKTARPATTQHLNQDVLSHFRRLYLSGMTFDKMTVELGLCRTTLDRYRELLDLPRRIPRRGTRYRRLQVRITEKDYAALKASCFGKHRSVANLVRSLLRERLG